MPFYTTTLCLTEINGIRTYAIGGTHSPAHVSTPARVGSGSPQPEQRPETGHPRTAHRLAEHDAGRRVAGHRTAVHEADRHI